MNEYEKIYIELEDILNWLEDTTEWEWYVSFFSEKYISFDIYLNKHKVQLMINLETKTFEYNAKLKLNGIDSYTDLILELRLYFDRVYKSPKKRKRSIKQWEDYTKN